MKPATCYGAFAVTFFVLATVDTALAAINLFFGSYLVGIALFGTAVLMTWGCQDAAKNFLRERRQGGAT